LKNKRSKKETLSLDLGILYIIDRGFHLISKRYLIFVSQRIDFHKKKNFKLWKLIFFHLDLYHKCVERNLLFISFKGDMKEALLVRIIPSFVEVIHIELSHKWWEIIVFEVPREYSLSKFIGLFNDKRLPWLIPADDII
jgi:hypothetical protein